MALSKTDRFLSKAEILGVGVFPPLSNFSHARKGKWPLQRGFFFEKAVSPFSRGRNRISQEAENRGSLISVPLALRVVIRSNFCPLNLQWRKGKVHSFWGVIAFL